MISFFSYLRDHRIRGIASEGMIMCASTPEKVEIITPPKGGAIGDRVHCPQFIGNFNPIYVILRL